MPQCLPTAYCLTKPDAACAGIPKEQQAACSYCLRYLHCHANATAGIPPKATLRELWDAQPAIENVTYRHLLSILTFFWLTSLLHNANERMRRQTLLKENRSRRALASLMALLVAQVCCISLLQGTMLPLQLELRRVSDFSAQVRARLELRAPG